MNVQHDQNIDLNVTPVVVRQQWHLEKRLQSPLRKARIGWVEGNCTSETSPAIPAPRIIPKTRNHVINFDTSVGYEFVIFQRPGIDLLNANSIVNDHTHNIFVICNFSFKHLYFIM